MSSVVKIAFGVAMVVFLLAPLFVILPLAFTSSTIISYPISGFSMRWFTELVTMKVWQRAVFNSIIIGLGVMLLATFLGTLAALAMRGRHTALFTGLRTIFLIPMVIPIVILGIGMQLIFVRMGFQDTHIAVILAHTLLAIPFVIINVSNSFASIDPAYERAAASLGASPFVVFRKITFPLSLPGILTGAVFAFGISFDEVVLTLFVAGPGQRTLAREMFSMLRENVSPAIAAVAFVFIVGTIILALAVALSRLLGHRKGRTSRAAIAMPE